MQAGLNTFATGSTDAAVFWCLLQAGAGMVVA
jgi:hypothetical protein